MSRAAPSTVLFAALLACGGSTMDSIAQTTSWQTPAYNATDYKGGLSMTWNVPAAAVNVSQFRYKIDGSTFTLIFQLEGTTIGGVPSNELAMRLPQGKAPTGWFSQPVCFATYVDPITTSWMMAQVYTTTGKANPFIGFVKMDQTPWAVWVGNPTVNLYCGPIVLEVQ